MKESIDYLGMVEYDGENFMMATLMDDIERFKLDDGSMAIQP